MKRIWGRVFNEDGTYAWTAVTTDQNGMDDRVYFTCLLQVLQLNLNESPFYGNYGIPSLNSIIHQILPDYYVSLAQQQFSSFFSSLTISRTGANPPTYNVQAITHSGAMLYNTSGVPQ